MKTPKFWNKKGFIAYLLMPISYLYRIITIIYHFTQTEEKLPLPVICIGNINAGGTGKTPIAIEIGLILQELGINFSYLSRGYGGNLSELTIVQNQKHRSNQVGDEPLILSEIGTTYISKNRLRAAKKIAQNDKNQILIIDDGLQDGKLYKDLSIIIIDGVYGFGNNFTIPSGPLRESAKSGFNKADLAIIIGEDKFDLRKSYPNKKFIAANIKPINYSNLQNKPLIAFCGIGRPEKFFTTLRNLNCNLIETIPYPDHYSYREKDIEKMLQLAKKTQATLVTTKKDWVRLNSKHRLQIEFLDIHIEIQEKQYLVKQLKNLNKS